MSLLKVSEVFCYICRGILIEPVTLPCFHVFCLTCFEKSMQETSHRCPFCRKRISNWLRSAKISNTLINKQLWEKIKEQFKEKVRLKLNGEDDGLDQCLQEENPVFLTTSKPGEVAQEFSQLLKEFKSENEKIKEAEELASKKLIEKLTEEEEKNRKHFEKTNFLRMKEDERLALKMQEEFNRESLKSKPTTRRNFMKEEKKTGPIDSFIKVPTDLDKMKTQKKFLCMDETNTEIYSGRSTSTDSTDSLRLEMNLFKPIKKVLTTPPKRYPDGKIKEINLTKVIPLKFPFSDSTLSSSERILQEGKKIHSNHSAFVGTNSCLNSEEQFESPSKRLKLSIDKSYPKALRDVAKENTETSQTNVAENVRSKRSKENTQILGHEYESLETQEYLDSDFLKNKVIEEQKRIEEIILQEKKDRELALKLSQEWATEEKRKPQTRSLLAELLRKNKNNPKKKIQQTLIDSFSRKNSEKNN